MLEGIIIFLIVIAAVFFLAKSIKKSRRDEFKCSSCVTSKTCSHENCSYCPSAKKNLSLKLDETNYKEI